MHETSMLRMKHFAKKYAKGKKVLDVGSYDYNGTYKKLFQDYDYTGLDMQEGPNVDIVMDNPYDWSNIETDSYDMVISGQTFEHVEFPWITISEMTRVLKKDGVMCIIAPNGFHEHRYPVDTYRYFTDGLVALCRYAGLDILHAETNCAPTKKLIKKWCSALRADSMIVSSKPYDGETQIVDLKNYKCVPADHEELNNGFIPFLGVTRKQIRLDGYDKV